MIFMRSLAHSPSQAFLLKCLQCLQYALSTVGSQVTQSPTRSLLEIASAEFRTC